MKITIGGPPGSGTTTVARIISDKLRIPIVSAGEMFRKLAEKQAKGLEEMSIAAEMDERIDRLIDEMQRDEASKMRDCVVEGRLSAFFVEDADLKVWLNAPIEVRARRVANREQIPYEEALNAIKRREQSEAERYRKYYGIDPNEPSAYDIVINSSKFSAEDIASIILLASQLVQKSTSDKSD